MTRGPGAAVDQAIAPTASATGGTSVTSSSIGTRPDPTQLPPAAPAAPAAPASTAGLALVDAEGWILHHDSAFADTVGYLGMDLGGSDARRLYWPPIPGQPGAGGGLTVLDAALAGSVIDAVFALPSPTKGQVGVRLRLTPQEDDAGQVRALGVALWRAADRDSAVAVRPRSGDDK